MLKYDFENNNAIVDLPSIWKISRDLILITHAGGTDNMSIPSDGLLTVQVGNIDSIISTSSSNSSYIDNTGNNTGNEGGSSSGNNGSSSSNSGNEGNNENLGGNENQGGNTGNEGGNTTPSGETYRSGVANITIVNNSSYYFDNSHTVSANNDTIDLQLVALAKVYVNSGSLSINLSVRENSLSSDLTLDSNNNPPCRSMSSGFTLSPGENKSILNVHWEVNSNDSNDYVPSSGLPIASTKHTLYIGNGYYSTSGSNGLGIVTISVSGENGYFKDGGNYTITIN